MTLCARSGLAHRVRRRVAGTAAIEPTPPLGYTPQHDQDRRGHASGMGVWCAVRLPAKKRHISEGCRCLRLSTPWRTSFPRPATSSARRSRRKATRSTISGIDSLDFLDIAFAIDKAFGIKLPLEQWTQEVNDGKASTEQYFVLKNLTARIDELIAAKSAPA
jgi:acyl carrier protein